MHSNIRRCEGVAEACGAVIGTRVVWQVGKEQQATWQWRLLSSLQFMGFEGSICIYAYDQAPCAFWGDKLCTTEPYSSSSNHLRLVSRCRISSTPGLLPPWSGGKGPPGLVDVPMFALLEMVLWHASTYAARCRRSVAAGGVTTAAAATRNPGTAAGAPQRPSAQACLNELILSDHKLGAFNTIGWCTVLVSGALS